MTTLLSIKMTFGCRAARRSIGGGERGVIGSTDSTNGKMGGVHYYLGWLFSVLITVALGRRYQYHLSDDICGMIHGIWCANKSLLLYVLFTHDSYSILLFSSSDYPTIVAVAQSSSESRIRIINSREEIMPKTLRDPDAPKRNTSAYLMYQNAMRETFLLQNPGMVSTF